MKSAAVRPKLSTQSCPKCSRKESNCGNTLLLCSICLMQDAGLIKHNGESLVREKVVGDRKALKASRINDRQNKVLPMPQQIKIDSGTNSV